MHFDKDDQISIMRINSVEIQKMKLRITSSPQVKKTSMQHDLEKTIDNL